jgi:putative heme iron utilization protein
VTDEKPAWIARKLLRGVRAATLATTAEGQPFASLVTPACAADLSLLLLLSDLSEHTRHLRADPRCSILVVGQEEGPNPQTTPRVSVTGTAEVVTDPALKARYLAVHPYAAMYSDFGDFALWRVQPVAGLIVAGFGRAARLRSADLTPDPVSVAAVEASAGDILTGCDSAALARLAGGPGAWRLVGVDVDGCDLALEERVVRVPWSASVSDAAGVRTELARLLGSAAETEHLPR